jgi:pyocin large subunit-like protein
MMRLAVITLPTWSPGNLLRHFRKHRHKFPFASVLDYERSSLATFRRGTRFTYDDGGVPRIGYYDKGTNRLTVVSDDGRAIITHFPPSGGERYCRSRTNSTYV